MSLKLSEQPDSNHDYAVSVTQGVTGVEEGTRQDEVEVKGGSQYDIQEDGGRDLVPMKGDDESKVSQQFKDTSIIEGESQARKGSKSSAMSFANLPVELLLTIISFLNADSTIHFLRSTNAIQRTLAHDKKVFVKIYRKLGSGSPLWNELYNLFPLIINNVASGTVESAQRIPDVVKEFSSIKYQRTWASELFFLISCEISFPSEDPFERVYYHLFIVDLQMMNSTLIKDKELYPIHILWRNFILRPEWKDNKDLSVTRIVTSPAGEPALEDDVSKTVFGEDFKYDTTKPTKYELCGDALIFWDHNSVIVIDLKHLENYWGSPTLPSKAISTGICPVIPNYTDDMDDMDEMDDTYMEDMDYVHVETQEMEAIKGVKTLLFEILQVRQTEDGPIFFRKMNRKFAAINVDTSSSSPKTATIRWEARLTTGVPFGWMSHVFDASDHSVCSSGKVDEFAFFGPNNTLGIKLKDEQLKIHQVELKKINAAQSKVHFSGKVIILQDLCPAGALRASDILCFNLNGDIVWRLDGISLRRDSKLLGYPRLELLPLIMINNGLLLLHAKNLEETLFLNAETGEVVSRVPDIGENQTPNLPAPDLIRVYWLGFRQINVYDLEYPGYFRIKRRNAEIINFA